MKKHQILLPLLLLLGTICHSQNTSRSCDPNNPTYYTISETYIYQRAKTTSAIVTKVPRGEKVNVIESDDYPNPNMWLICHKGKSGYALEKLLSYDKVEPREGESTDPDILNKEDQSKQYGGLFGSQERKPINDRIADLFTSAGTGTIGGGLENRGGVGPDLEDRTKEQVKVVIRICVDSNGKVVSADFTQRGSTTQSSTLISLAKKNALLYSFNSSSYGKQCGTIAYDFRIDETGELNSGFVEGQGAVTRKRISSPPLSDLMKKRGRVVVKVCINRGGEIIFAEYDSDNSTLDDIGHQERAIDFVQKIVFERNDDAPVKECGRLTFKMTR